MVQARTSKEGLSLTLSLERLEHWLHSTSIPVGSQQLWV